MIKNKPLKKAWLVAVRVKTKNEIYAFETKKQRDLFVLDLRKQGCEFSYTIGKVLL